MGVLFKGVKPNAGTPLFKFDFKIKIKTSFKKLLLLDNVNQFLLEKFLLIF